MAVMRRQPCWFTFYCPPPSPPYLSKLHWHTHTYWRYNLVVTQTPLHVMSHVTRPPLCSSSWHSLFVIHPPVQYPCSTQSSIVHVLVWRSVHRGGFIKIFPHPNPRAKTHKHTFLTTNTHARTQTHIHPNARKHTNDYRHINTLSPIFICQGGELQQMF